MGYCGRDRRRAPLTGVELRPCWEEGPRAGQPQASVLTPAALDGGGREPRDRRTAAVVRGDGGPLDRPDPMRLRGFVPLDELARPEPLETPSSPPPAILADAPQGWETRTTLFGDAEA